MRCGGGCCRTTTASSTSPGRSPSCAPSERPSIQWSVSSSAFIASASDPCGRDRGGHQVTGAAERRRVQSRRQAEPRCAGTGVLHHPPPAQFSLCLVPRWFGSLRCSRTMLRRRVLHCNSRKLFQHCFRVVHGHPVDGLGQPRVVVPSTRWPCTRRCRSLPPPGREWAQMQRAGVSPARVVLPRPVYFSVLRHLNSF